MLRRAGQWQGNRSPDNQTANKLVDAGGSWFEDVGSTPTASISIIIAVPAGDCQQSGSDSVRVRLTPNSGEDLVKPRNRAVP